MVTLEHNLAADSLHPHEPVTSSVAAELTDSVDRSLQALPALNLTTLSGSDDDWLYQPFHQLSPEAKQVKALDWITESPTNEPVAAPDPGSAPSPLKKQSQSVLELLYDQYVSSLQPSSPSLQESNSPEKPKPSSLFSSQTSPVRLTRRQSTSALHSPTKPLFDTPTSHVQISPTKRPQDWASPNKSPVRVTLFLLCSERGSHLSSL